MSIIFTLYVCYWSGGLYAINCLILVIPEFIKSIIFITTIDNATDIITYDTLIYIFAINNIASFVSTRSIHTNNVANNVAKIIEIVIIKQAYFNNFIVSLARIIVMILYTPVCSIQFLLIYI